MPFAGDSRERDPIKPWFNALESTGEFIGIRFGRLSPGAREPEWTYLPHSEYDGLGGFAHLLRSAGVEAVLPTITPHSGPISWKPFIRSLPRMLGARRRLAWSALPRGEATHGAGQPAPAVAWHVFTKDETAALIRHSRAGEVTLNSLLMTHLDAAVRPDLAVPEAGVPWMVPVNLRGMVDRSRDTANHTSYIAIKIPAGESARGVHDRVYEAIRKGEHWANWHGYSLGRLFPAAVKRWLLRTDRALSQWNVGGFSNMGAWDAEGAITGANLTGSWLFCPPVLRSQMIGAGCMTFQGRLSLLIQAHPELTTAPEVPEGWMRRWLASLRIEAAAGPPSDGPGTAAPTAAPAVPHP